MRKCKVNWGDIEKDKETYYFHEWGIGCLTIIPQTVGILENIKTRKTEIAFPECIIFIKNEK